MMRVTIRLHATLKKYQPPGSKDAGIILELPEGATLADVISRLGIPPAHAKMMVSDDEHLQLSTVLRDGLSVDLFPPLAGGM